MSDHKKPNFFDRHPYWVFAAVFVACFIFMSIVTNGR